MIPWNEKILKKKQFLGLFAPKFSSKLKQTLSLALSSWTTPPQLHKRVDATKKTFGSLDPDETIRKQAFIDILKVFDQKFPSKTAKKYVPTRPLGLNHRVIHTKEVLCRPLGCRNGMNNLLSHFLQSSPMKLPFKKSDSIRKTNKRTLSNW